MRSDVLIEEDAEVAHADQGSPFIFFDSIQWQVIGSIVTLPLPMNNKRPAEFVISIDTDRKGFFRKNQKERYKSLADNLGRRLHLSLAIERLVKLVSLESKNDSRTRV